ncbi:bPT2, partial [Symbiodinium necroappetens]
MPPRRPGGKYKGLVTRNKSDAALAKEASERAKKQQEEMVKRAAMRKQKELMDRNGLGTELVDPEEEKRQRILNLMMGGRKGDIIKFFQAWRKGATQQRKETKIREREIGWRANCGGTDPDLPGGCTSVKLLMPANMALPLNNFLNITSGESETFRTSRG